MNEQKFVWLVKMTGSLRTQSPVLASLELIGWKEATTGNTSKRAREESEEQHSRSTRGG